MLDHLNSKPPKLPKGFPSLISLEHFTTSKVVSKNWGHERWLIHTSSSFALKIIFLKAGFRTSLQYHKKKEEAGFVLSGELRLHYASTDDKSICQLDLSPGTVFHIKPSAIHRIEAVTDTFLIETSTVELDDVIRVNDDWNRPDGRIDSEHSPKK